MSERNVELEKLARAVRRRVWGMVHRAQCSHVGSAFSIVDLLVTLYFDVLRIDPAHPSLPERDRFILSKGHASAALYATLVERGFAPESVLESFYGDGAQLAGHPILGSLPGIEASTGSLGHGLSLGAGIAVAERYAGRDSRVYVLAGDGECNEGAIWEAAMFAAAKQLSRLTVLVDYNRLQGLGSSDEVLAVGPLADKWRAFGWSVEEVDGHDIGAVREALGTLERSELPGALIAHTVKGRGVSFCENQLAWHYRSPNDALYAQGLAELQES